MNVSVCRHHTTAARAADFPREGLPEIAFMGRSNVGKSSLINRLLGRRLARTSKTPGRTRAIHFYRINERVDFVDLPGYGYARVPRPLREEWRGLVEAYLGCPGRPDLAVVLVDARHEPTEMDRELLEWLRSRGTPHRVVLTKSDKLSGNGRARALRDAGRVLEAGGDDALLPVSAVTGDGLPVLWRAIDAACAARRSPALEAPPRDGGGMDHTRRPAAGDGARGSAGAH